MKEQKDHHLEAPGEANRDKRINFLAAENGDADSASDSQSSNTDESGNDNGFFTDDDSRLETKDEYEEEKISSGKNEKTTPLVEGTAEILGDRITLDSRNQDMLTPVDDKEPPYEQGEDDQAH